LIAAVAARERAPRDDAALTRACVQAFCATGERLPRIPSLRVVRVRRPDGRPLPSDWALLVEPGEVPIVIAVLPKPFSGFVAAVARVDDLRKPKLTDAERDRIAEQLVDALLREESCA
jgi:hypothetical protein